MAVEDDVRQAMTTNRLTQIPNALSLARLFLVPLVLMLVNRQEWQGAFWVFIAAGLTDALDGTLARLLKAQTLLGAWLDPLADKVLLVSIYLSLAIWGQLPLWLAVLVVLRDVVIVLYATFDIVAGNLPIRPLLISKINTLTQVILAALVLGQQAFGLGNPMLTEGFVIAVALTTTASGAAYLMVRH